MHISRIPFAQVPALSRKDIAYATAEAALRPFYKYEATLAAFEEAIADKREAGTDRATLVEVLRSQYAQLATPPQVHEQIAKLALPNTFTVVTAHQPSLLTGPLYYIYKIASTINLARQLAAAYPDCHFVPVFVSGGEDHDFEEVNHAHLYNKTLVWDSGERGSVGMMKTASLQPVLADLKEILGDSEAAAHMYTRIQAAYTGHERYAEATQALVDDLFGQEGLVMLNMNDARLKRLFIPIMRAELLEQASQPLVEAAQAALEAAGYGGQAHARDINLFYLREQVRERIVRTAPGSYEVLNTDYRFTEAELMAELEGHPEHFSPNVVLRPLYQELVLPNLAYIGGGGEIAYWLERKAQFAHFGVNFPMLVRRNSLLWIDTGSLRRMEKLGLSTADIFMEKETLLKRYVRDNAENELSLGEEKAALESLFGAVAQKAGEVDATLVKTVLAEQAKQVKALEQIEARLVKAEKQKHEVALGQLRALKDKLFPGNGLQERHDNFLSIYLKHGDAFLSLLIQELNPLEEGLLVVQEE